MIQQWLLKIGGEINNGNMELQRQVCTCRNLLGCFLPWLRVFFKGKTKSWLIEVGDWEGKMGTCIITQMVSSGFLNEVCYRVWNEVSAMIKSFWDPVTIFTLYSVYGEGSGTPLQYSCLENPWTEEPSRLQSMGSLRVGHESDFIFTFLFHALEKEMATHSSVLAWRIPGTGEPGGLPSMGLHRVGHDWSDLAAV